MKKSSDATGGPNRSTGFPVMQFRSCAAASFDRGSAELSAGTCIPDIEPRARVAEVLSIRSSSRAN